MEWSQQDGHTGRLSENNLRSSREEGKALQQAASLDHGVSRYQQPQIQPGDPSPAAAAASRSFRPSSPAPAPALPWAALSHMGSLSSAHTPAESPAASSLVTPLRELQRLLGSLTHRDLVLEALEEYQRVLDGEGA